MNINPFLAVEVFLTIEPVELGAADLTSVLTHRHKVNQVMHIGPGTCKQKLQFLFSLAEENLNRVIETISQEKYSIREITIHFTSAVSGIHDNYHSAAAVTIEEALLKIPEVINVSISANGIVKIEINALNQDQNSVLLAALETIKTNLSQSN